MKQVSQSKLSYRAEIDGLRAIAVLSVIFYHAQFILFGRDWFEGGYIGVDIFFVISGYLITRIILAELQEEGGFSFLNFYQRRARRILPMLFVVIIVSVPFAWHKLWLSDFVEYAESLLASLFFGSNLFFYFNATGYATDSALLKPFLHTWSLGVEEQFYLIFPILAIAAYRYCRKYFLAILVFSCLLSLLFAELMQARDQTLNFYILLSRFWELAIGSVLAYVELNRKVLQNNAFRSLLPTLGLLLITYSVLVFDDKTPHPSLYTLIPVLGVALIIGFASEDDWVGRLLGRKLFVWIGLISYSAYLWHFPIFALSRHTPVDHSNLEKLEWVLLALILSAISYVLIEKPFRDRFKVGDKVFVFSISLSAVAVIAFSLATINGYIENNDKGLVPTLMDRKHFREEHRAFEVDYDYSVNRSDKQSLLVVGNSHAEDLLKTLSFSNFNERYHLNLVSPLKRVDDVNYQVRCLWGFLQTADTLCEGVQFGPNIVDQYDAADVVLLASAGESKYDLKVLPPLIKTLVSDGKKVVVVTQPPQSKTFGVQKLTRFDRFLFENRRPPNNSELIKLEQLFYEDYILGQSKVNQRLESIVQSVLSDQVVFADRSDFMCNHAEQRCRYFFPEQSAKVLWDYSHVTTEGAKGMAALLDGMAWLASDLKESEQAGALVIE